MIELVLVILLVLLLGGALLNVMGWILSLPLAVLVVAVFAIYFIYYKR